jgi:Icc-related predicted phosphoesterase
MIIDCISDLHGFYPKLEGGDLLIVAGDLTASDTEYQHNEFSDWLEKQDYPKKIVISGNHDGLLQGVGKEWAKKMFPDATYLEDSGLSWCGLKIWGSPWTKTFEGINPKCKAFTVDTEEELAEKWKLIPEDIDILITHSPPYGVRDRAKRKNGYGFECVGSKTLQMAALNFHSLKLWVMGHIHEDYGEEAPGGNYPGKIVNASHVNERYESENKPIRVIL